MNTLWVLMYVDIFSSYFFENTKKIINIKWYSTFCITREFLLLYKTGFIKLLFCEGLV